VKKRVIAVFAALMLFISGGVAVAGPASAGTCTIVTSSWHLCGKVTAVGNCGVRISNGWPANYGTQRTLYNGQSSTRYFRDTDAYMIPTKCRTGALMKKGVWIKVRDGMNVTVVSR